VFQDDFEHGTVNAWTSTRITNGESTNIITSQAYSGNNSALFATNGLEGSEIACVYKNLSPALNIIYTQAHFRITQNGMAENGDRIKLMELRAGTTIIASAGFWQNNDRMCWWMETRDGTTYQESYTSPVTINVSEWFSLELRWLNNATTGGGSLWINGVLIYDINNADTDNYGGCSEVRIGLTETYNCATTNAHVDSAVISNTDIDSSQVTPPTTTPPTDAPPSNNESPYSNRRNRRYRQ
jgi:hypothetical protein